MGLPAIPKDVPNNTIKKLRPLKWSESVVGAALSNEVYRGWRVFSLYLTKMNKKWHYSIYYRQTDPDMKTLKGKSQPASQKAHELIHGNAQQHLQACGTQVPTGLKTRPTREYHPTGRHAVPKAGWLLWVLSKLSSKKKVADQLWAQLVREGDSSHTEPRCKWIVIDVCEPAFTSISESVGASFEVTIPPGQSMLHMSTGSRYF